MPTTFPLSYYPWITQHVAPDELRRYVIDFARELGSQLTALSGTDYYIEVQQPVEVPRQIEMIASGLTTIALMNPLGYVFARARQPAVEAIAVALREIDGKVGPTYFAQLYTNKKTAIRFSDPKGLAVARGKSIGYGVPYSTSNFLVPAYHLATKLGVHPFAFFSRAEFVGGHELVAKAVYEGRVDIGAGHDGVIKDLARQYGYGDAEDRLVTIARSEPIPSDPVAVHLADPAQRALLLNALVATAGTAVGAEALRRFWGMVAGLAPIAPDAYALLDSAMTRLGLTEQDVLR